MVVKIIPFTLFILALFSMQAKAKTEYSPEQYIKNYALSVCLAKGYDSKDVKEDASAAARGYLEFGDYSLEAHTAVNNLADNFLAKKYSSQSGASMILAKCIDFYHSEELNKLIKDFKNKTDS